VIDGAFAYAFSAGMVASVNPCGFAMLPAYLSYFLGLEGHADDRSTSARLARALVVSGAVTLGFVVVFLGIGAIVNAGFQQVVDYMKWASIVIGVGLVVLGIAVMAGYRLPITTPRLDKGGRSRSLGSMVLFGVSYAVASIGCTLPIFLGIVFGGIDRDGFFSATLSFVLYALGMGLVLTALTVSLALAEGGLLRFLRKAMRWVDRLAGLFLVIAGLYLIYYWTFTLRFESTGSLDGGGLASWVERQSSEATAWVSARPWTLGILFGAIAVAAVAFVLLRRRPGRIRRARADGGGTVEAQAS
jgi:cytochrome c biogenesis protein CcdA